MAHEIDLKNFSFRTDMIVESIDKLEDSKDIIHNTIMIKDVIIDDVYINKSGEKKCGKASGRYKTITFKDITDKEKINRNVDNQ